jgi:hypothetical protein
MEDEIIFDVLVESYKCGDDKICYFGPCPIDDLERNKLIGLDIIINGEKHKIINYEYFATVQGPRKDEIIGIIVKDI